MPPTFTTSALGREPLCARCARATRLVAASPSSRATSRRAFILSSSAAVPEQRTPLPARHAPLRQARLLSQSSRTPTAAPARQPQPTARRSSPASAAAAAAAAAAAPPASSDSPAASAPPAAAPTGPPSFYALFPKTLPLGPPPGGPFDIDVRALRTEFLRLQAAAHPDFHHHASSSSSGSAVDDLAAAAAGGGVEGGGGGGGGGRRHSAARARAEALSSLINEAYRTLASPLLRAQYILRQRHGVDLAGDESTTLWAGSGESQQSDTELLMAVLEVREDIERAASEADLEPIRADNDARMRASEAALAAAFAADDAAAARREAVRLRYWVNIDDSVRNWERGKDIVLEH